MELIDNSLIFKVKDLISLVKSNINSTPSEEIYPIYHFKSGNQREILFTINYCNEVLRIHFTDYNGNLSSKFVGYVFDMEETVFSKNTVVNADIFFPLIKIDNKKVIEEFTLALQKKNIESITIREIIRFRDLYSLSEYIGSLSYACNFIYELELLEKKRIFFQIISIDGDSLTLLIAHRESQKNDEKLDKNVHLIELEECSICNRISQLLEGVRE